MTNSAPKNGQLAAHRISGKLGGDGFLRIATLVDGRWEAEPNLTERLQVFLNTEYVDQHGHMNVAIEFDLEGHFLTTDN